jgi:hypothetical protein
MAKSKEGRPVVTLGELTLSHFVPHLGSTFPRVKEDSPDVVLVLASATSLARRAGGNGGRREPFSLIFTGPRDVALSQGIHPLRHAELGSLDIFLVPIGIDAAGRRYEAIFT